MALRWFFALTFLSALFLPVTAVKAQTLDQYGGYTSLPVPGGATGSWRTAKLGTRWVFVTPLGNAFWLNGIYNVNIDLSTDDMGGNYYSRILAKYGTIENWGAQQTARISSWGFNTVAEYADTRVWDRLAGVFIIKPTWNSLTSRFVTGGCPTKDIMNGINTSVYTGYVAPMADFFDPCYADFVNRYVAAHKLGAPAAYTSSKTIGLTPDDRDDLFGFGPGVEVDPGVSSPHPHVGWIVLATNAAQSSNTNLSPSQTYSDTKVYAKYALRDQLVAKYGTIAALNAAWGSSYTTFDSSGGWGNGSGLLDENGNHAAHPWIPTNTESLAGATAAFVTDMDNYLLAYARKYFSITTSIVRSYTTNNALIFGPAALNSTGLTRKQILQAAGEYVDVLTAVIANQTVLNLTAQYFGDKPIVSYELTQANPDSALFRYPNVSPTDPARSFTTQAARGAGYAALLSAKVALTATNGVQPIAGIRWWEFHDNWREKGGWGLVSLSDNAYDGKEAIIAPGTDPWGYRTGGEERNYGDFLSQVVTANAGVAAAIDAGGAAPPPSGTTVSITSPTSGSTVQQTVTVSAAASSSAVRIDLALDGSLMGTFGGTTVMYSWNTTASTNTTHRWVAKAYDASGSSITSSPVDVVVSNVVGNPDTTPPVVSITKPTDGGFVARKTKTTIQATASDNVGVTRVEFYVNGSLKCSITVAPYACQWQVPAASPGAGKVYQLQAKAYDPQGNVGSSSIVRVQAQ